jgi:hypothetical protein
MQVGVGGQGQLGLRQRIAYAGADISLPSNPFGSCPPTEKRGSRLQGDVKV